MEKHLFVLWYRVRDGTLAWADFQVAMQPLMVRVKTLLEEGMTGAWTPMTGPVYSGICGTPESVSH